MNYDFSNITILIAEDEKYNRFYLKELFKQTKATLIMAENGQQAVEFAETNPGIDIALLDIKMPVMDGIQAASILRRKFSKIPLIAVTAFVQEFYNEVSFEEKFDAYLPKPINPGKLFQLIESYTLGVAS
jgi:CheY-like chemotaxis protein